MAVVPIRSFAGLTRLAGVLDADERAALMRRLAEGTCATLVGAGASITIVTGDTEVGAWAGEHGFSVLAEPEPPGLDAAAAAGVKAAAGPWLVVHADLPAITKGDIVAAVAMVGAGCTVIAPSRDGGTSLIGATGPTFPFSYGVGSFRRHLGGVPVAAVLIRPGLALDLDRVGDLEALGKLRAGDASSPS